MTPLERFSLLLRRRAAPGSAMPVGVRNGGTAVQVRDRPGAGGAVRSPLRIDRRTMVLGVAAAVTAIALPGARPAYASTTAQRIADHFTRVRTMMGEFVQFGPSGEQTGGRFFIQRPGRVLFLYDDPSSIRVVADGRSVAVNNRKLKTWDVYRLGQTPLKLVLGDHIDLSGGRLVSVTEGADLTTIVMQDRQVFGDSTITMMFDPKTYELRQWTIRDAQGKNTTVMLYNVKEGVTFGPGTFDIDYARIRREQERR